jgi:ferredoxin
VPVRAPANSTLGDIFECAFQERDIVYASRDRDRDLTVCQSLVQAYTVLADENTRELYNIDLEESRLEEKYGFTGQAFSEWLPATQPELARNWNGAERRALFVDERTCIGCKSCVWQASNTFVMEEEHGRARVTKQWADVEDSLQNAVGTDCFCLVHRVY